MAGCGLKMTEYVPRGYDYKEITVKCGNTSPDGNPYLCEECELQYTDVNWRREDELNGETWDENGY